MPWINHEWLSEVLFGAAFSVAGGTGLVALKALVAGAAYAVLWKATAPVALPTRWAIALVAVAASLPLTYTVRPQLWSLLLLLLLATCLRRGSRLRWFAPILFVPWANLHGGWIVGLGLIASSAGAAGVRRDWRSCAELVGVAALSTLATLVNPYGVDLWQFIAETVRFSRADIQEWTPIWRDGLSSSLLWLAGTGVLVVTFRRRRAPLDVLLVIGAFLIAAALVNRLVPLVVPMAIVLVAPFLQSNKGPTRVPFTRSVLDLIVTMAVVVAVCQRSGLRGCVRVEGDWVPDPAGMTALKNAGAEGRVVTFFNWGEYAIWHLSPRLWVSFDGRRETIYSPETISTQMAIARGDRVGLAALEVMKPDYIWLPAQSHATRDWAAQHGYRIDIRTSRSFVATRGDLPVLQPSSPSDTRCFP